MSMPGNSEIFDVQLGYVLCEGVASEAEAGRLRAEIAQEEERFVEILAGHDATLRTEGIDEKTVALDRYVAIRGYKEEGIPAEEAHRIVEEGEDGALLTIGEFTKFAVGENVWDREPGIQHDVNDLFVTIRNNELGLTEESPVKVGSWQQDGSGRAIYDPFLEKFPEDLYLTREQLMVVHSLVRRFRAPIVAEALPHLLPGTFNMLVIQGSGTSANPD